jgi:hypothetical protein
MSPIDIVIILVVLGSILPGFQNGAIRLLGAGIGLMLGLSIGTRISLLVTQAIASSTIRLVVFIVITGCIGFGLLLAGSRIGRRLKTQILLKPVNTSDNYAGIVVGMMGALIMSWLLASFIYTFASSRTQSSILGSKIVVLIDQQTPLNTVAFHLIDPKPAADIGQIVSGPGGAAPYSITPTLPFQGPFAQAITKDYPSVVYLLWQPGCMSGDTYAVGSGYVAAPRIVVTAAHVVAGAGTVTVIDSRGQSLIGSVILFDAKHDVAVVDVPGLTAPAIALDPTLHSAGTPVALMGYPGGSAFTASNGTIQGYNTFAGFGLSSIGIEFGHDSHLYHSSLTTAQGDSGGPLITQSGAVIGHFTVFTTQGGFVSEFDSSYFESLHDYYAELQQSQKHPQRVSTGSCPAE